MGDFRLPMVNEVRIVGSLVNDPQLGHNDQGVPVVNFRIASRRRFKHHGEKKEDTCFVNVACWSKLAEGCMDYLKKRHFVYIEGELKSRDWITKSGDKTSNVSILARKIQFLTKVNNEEMFDQEEENED